MNPIDIRKRLHAFAIKMEKKLPLDDEEYLYLNRVFSRIAAGEDANEVLGILYSRGHSENDAIGRQKLSRVLHWVAGAIDPDTGFGYKLEEALQIAHKEFDYPHDLGYLRKRWYEQTEMQSAFRKWSDPDSPFDPEK